ncbi:PIN domain-containing protein [Eggerthellaceae bacterium zg-887]|uniref:PIN domain-containing protein n=1 Tax=Xiamenia xianingshaonis TaxID=2682776 RepID=UPI00140A9560|nr:PIN domain-containing protein [Xiamenia xianingshaonis]NHM16064.1 PIN domain-containing protein [Xiamenia xianingshaonis]
MKLFLDTNALLDYYVRREPYFESLKAIRIAQIFGDVELWACAQSFPDIEYVLRKAVPAAQMRRMMHESLSFINVVAPTAADVERGLASDWPDLEDFLIAACAERIGADCLVTRDRKGFQSSRLTVKTPAEWVADRESQDIVYAKVVL